MPSATVLHDTLRVKVGFIIILHAQNRINYILILFFCFFVVFCYPLTNVLKLCFLTFCSPFLLLLYNVVPFEITQHVNP